MNFGFSIVICCYNSASKIEETLRHLTALDLPPNTRGEVLLIDNNSTDETASIARGWQEKLSGKALPLRIVGEPRPGLSFARARGVSESAYDIIVFCDDDNHLAANYLTVANKVLTSHPEVGLLGGWAKEKFSLEGRGWLRDFLPAMAIGQQAESDGVVSWIYGAGMVIRKSVYRDLEKRKISFYLSDRQGAHLTSGGDAEICVLARHLGYKIWYASDLVLWHDIPVHRLDRKHYMKATYGTVFPSAYLYLLDAVVGGSRMKANGHWRNFWVKNLGQLLYYLPRIVVGKHKFFSLFSFYRTGQIVTWTLLNRTQFRGMYNDIHRKLSLKL